ncbi:hypothetical protein [Pseudomonas putida]
MKEQTTGTATFGPVDTHNLPLFTITPGFNGEDALAHVTVLLKGAEACAYELTESPGDTAHGLAIALVHQLEQARGIVNALLAERPH